MEHCLFPSIPNTSEVNDLKSFHWEVSTGGTVGICHAGSSEPFLELLTVEPVEPPGWMGDVLSWPDRGEFVMAIGRGLVVCMAVRGVRVRGEADESAERIFKLESRDGPGFLTYEWEESLTFAPMERAGWLEARVPSTDMPLMLYVQATGADGDAALALKKLQRLQRVNLAAVVTRVQGFQHELPAWQSEPKLERLWNFVLHLHRVSTYEPQTPLRFNWECPSRADVRLCAVHGGMDSLSVVWDWLLLDPDRAREEFANTMRGFDEESGMMAARIDVDGQGPRNVCSHPPLWPTLAWRLYLVLRDRNFLEEMLRIGLKNVAWWERSRDADGDGLFEYAESGQGELCESGYPGSPRFDPSRRADDVRLTSIDLCCQMISFYGCLRQFAAELGEKALQKDFEGRAERLIDRVRKTLWDEKTGFFYDRRDGKPIRVRTVASFFSLLSGVAVEEQVVKLCEQLADEKAFFRTCPVPSVAADEGCFELTGWRGPSSPAQTLWVVAGLRHVGRPRLAAQIARRALNAMADVLERDGTVYEFYNPDGPDQSSVRSPGGKTPVARHHVGSAPVHALIALGLYGIEMTRDGLVVDPVGTVLPEESAIEVQLPETRLVVLVRRTDVLDGIELKVRANRRVLGEGYGRTVIGLGKLL